MRIRCWLFGCYIPDYEPCCNRCSADLYDYEFYQAPAINRYRGTAWMVNWWLVLDRERRRVTHRCEVCGKRMWRNAEPCCSEDCDEAWIPF